MPSGQVKGKEESSTGPDFMEECQACVFKVLYLKTTQIQAKEIYFKKLAADMKTLVHKMLMENLKRLVI